MNVRGDFFNNYPNDAIVKALAEETTTKTGLTVRVRINEKVYQTGQKVDPDEVAQLRIEYHERLGK